MTTQSQAVEIIRADERGHTDAGWLDSWHSFSFGEWQDPRRMGVGPLRVLNDDRVAAGMGFGAHPHRDMEIISYVLEGGLAHRDSGGNSGVIHAGEVQFMRAGTGVVHSEMNASKTEPVHFLQVWIRPRTRGLAPKHEQRRLEVPETGEWVPIAGEAGFAIDADARMLAARVAAGGSARVPLPAGRTGYLFVIEGEVSVAGATLRTGDAVTLSAGSHEARAGAASHLLFFDLGAV